MQCRNGKLYIAPVFDCFGGEIVSIAMDTNMKKELCMKAIANAYKSRNPGSGVIIHSDAGNQYTSCEYKKLLGELHAVQSMSDVAKNGKDIDTYQSDILEQAREDIQNNVSYIESKISENGLDGYSLYIYLVPFADADEDKKDIMDKLLQNRGGIV